MSVPYGFTTSALLTKNRKVDMCETQHIVHHNNTAGDTQKSTQQDSNTHRHSHSSCKSQGPNTESTVSAKSSVYDNIGVHRNKN